MKAIWLYLKYLFWNVVYCFVREGNTLESYLRKVNRCWWPWREFVPHAWHDEIGRQWEVCFEDASSYTRGGLETIRVEVSYAIDDRRVTKIDIFDADLKRLQGEANVEAAKMEELRQSLRMPSPSKDHIPRNYG